MYHIIINPASRSGKGMKIWNALLPLLQEQQILYRAYFTKRSGHVTQIVRKLTTHPTRKMTFIVLGGDGTMNEVLQGIVHFELAKIAYIPTGSSNDLARSLDLETNPQKALLHILDTASTSTRMLDLGLLQYNSGFSMDAGSPATHTLPASRLFCVSAGIGFDAAVCEKVLVSHMKNFLNHIGLGKLTYLSIALGLLLTPRKVSCDIYLDDGTCIHHDNFLFIVTMIQKYEGGGFLFCPDASPDDGFLDICAAGNISLPKALRILPSAFKGQHLRFKEVSSYRVKTLRIKTASPLWVHTDGEVYASSDDITLSISENHLLLLS